MTPFGWLRGLGRVTNTLVPREPSGAELARRLCEQPPRDAAAVADAIEGLDIRLAELSDIPALVRTEQQWDEIDRLLDRRMRLACPSVPVVPGRTS